MSFCKVGTHAIVYYNSFANCTKLSRLRRVSVIFLRRAFNGAREVKCSGGGRNRIAVPTLGDTLKGTRVNRVSCAYEMGLSLLLLVSDSGPARHSWPRVGAAILLRPL